jgi:hypothetical protein
MSSPSQNITPYPSKVDKKPLTNSKKLCVKKYFSELEDIGLLTKIFHSRPPFLFTV